MKEGENRSQQTHQLTEREIEILRSRFQDNDVHITQYGEIPVTSKDDYTRMHLKTSVNRHHELAENNIREFPNHIILALVFHDVKEEAQVERSYHLVREFIEHTGLHPYPAHDFSYGKPGMAPAMCNFVFNKTDWDSQKDAVDVMRRVLRPQR
jgi:hypothetical protein